MKQQAKTLVEKKIVKGTAGEMVREQKQDRYKKKREKGNKNENESDNRKIQSCRLSRVVQWS